MLVRPLVRSVVSPLVRSVTTRGRRGVDARTAATAAVFASITAPKLWVDPSYAPTRFQDFAGSTLVTADGQPLARLNDRSGAGNHVGQAAGASMPLYQTDGTLHWARADGSNDSWYSLANFDMSSTDKVTLIVGLRKRSDANVGAVVELGSNANVNAGTFGLLAPLTAGVGNARWQGQGAGSGFPSAVAPGLAAPVSFIVTCVMNIGANSGSLQINDGVPIAFGASLGTGNFVSAILNIFRRNNASLPAAIDLFGLMVVGSIVPPADLLMLRTYTASKSGVIL